MTDPGPAGLFCLPPGVCVVKPGYGLGLHSEYLLGGGGEVDVRRPVEALFVPFAADPPGAGERALAALRGRLPGVADVALSGADGPTAFVILLLESPADMDAVLALSKAEGFFVARASVLETGRPSGTRVLNLRGLARGAFPEKDGARLSALAPFVAATPGHFLADWAGRDEQDQPLPLPL